MAAGVGALVDVPEQAHQAGRHDRPVVRAPLLEQPHAGQQILQPGDEFSAGGVHSSPPLPWLPQAIIRESCAVGKFAH
ncbi:hypothetical protein [Micromonospora fulviviridis]|uniref:Uncharacterized protein n=1 Tax=Micromonospora fulviviridis TaxID=47860 RepID=A0ABV2VLN1_9ACTN